MRERREVSDSDRKLSQLFTNDSGHGAMLWLHHNLDFDIWSKLLNNKHKRSERSYAKSLFIPIQIIFTQSTILFSIVLDDIIHF